MSTTTLRALGALLLVPALLTGQRPTLSAAVKQYVAVDTLVVALTHVRVIDGTGAAPKEDQTLIIRDGNIVALGAARSTRVPEGAQVLDLTGKSVIPGLVMMHEARDHRFPREVQHLRALRHSGRAGGAERDDVAVTDDQRLVFFGRGAGAIDNAHVGEGHHQRVN